MSKIELNLNNIISPGGIEAFDNLIQTIQNCGNDCLILKVGKEDLPSEILSFINFIHTNNGEDKNKELIVQSRF